MENFIFKQNNKQTHQNNGKLHILNKIINKLTRTMENFIFKQNNKQTHQNNGKLHI